MPVIKLRWSSLLNMTDLQFEPPMQNEMIVSDRVQQSISWLTGATGHDRRLLRCNEDGALLVDNAWSLLNVVEYDELTVDAGVSDSFADMLPNKGVLISTGSKIIKCVFTRVSGGDGETVYVPANTMYWFPHTTWKVAVWAVPAASGGASYIGVTTFK